MDSIPFILWIHANCILKLLSMEFNPTKVLLNGFPYLFKILSTYPSAYFLTLTNSNIIFKIRYNIYRHLNSMKIEIYSFGTYSVEKNNQFVYLNSSFSRHTLHWEALECFWKVQISFKSALNKGFFTGGSFSLKCSTVGRKYKSLGINA